MYLGALEAGGTKMVCAIGNEFGEVFERASFPTRMPEETMADIIAYFKDKNIEALGISSFGPLNLDENDPNFGDITTTPKPGWKDYPLRRELMKALNVPVGIDTDVNAAALAEAKLGAGNGIDSLVYYTIGTGIGGAILIDGKIYHGHNFLAGELGHFVIQHGGRQCICGLQGCFEQYASATALIRQTQEAIEETPESILAQLGAAGVDGRTVFAAAEKGCPVADRVLQNYLAYLATGINSLTYIFQPQKIVLAGGIAKAGSVLTDRLQPFLIPYANVSLSSLTGNSGIIGAAMLPVFSK